MKQKTAKKPLLIQRHPLYILFSVLLTTFVVIFAFSLINRAKNATTESSIIEDSTKNDSELSKDDKKDTDEKSDDDKTSDFDSPKPTYSDVASSLSVSISYADFIDNSLKVYSSISVLTSGTCRLTLTAPGFETTYDAEIIANPSSSACATFSIPAENLPRSLKLTLDITTNTGETATTTKEITL